MINFISGKDCQWGRPKLGRNGRKLLAAKGELWTRRKQGPPITPTSVEFTHSFSSNKRFTYAHGVRPLLVLGIPSECTRQSPALKIRGLEATRVTSGNKSGPVGQQSFPNIQTW